MIDFNLYSLSVIDNSILRIFAYLSFRLNSCFFKDKAHSLYLSSLSFKASSFSSSPSSVSIILVLIFLIEFVYVFSLSSSLLTVIFLLKSVYTFFLHLVGIDFVLFNFLIFVLAI